MRIINYEESEQLAECTYQIGRNVFSYEIHNIEYVKKFDVHREEFDIELIHFDAWQISDDGMVLVTLTEDQIYDFKRGLLEYIDFESESDMFDGGDREGSCW